MSQSTDTRAADPRGTIRRATEMTSQEEWMPVCFRSRQTIEKPSRTKSLVKGGYEGNVRERNAAFGTGRALKSAAS